MNCTGTVFFARPERIVPYNMREFLLLQTPFILRFILPSYIPAMVLDENPFHIININILEASPNIRDGINFMRPAKENS